MDPIHINPQSSPPRRRQRAMWLALAAVVAVLALAIMALGIRSLTRELAKAKPIPGITIVVDTGNAVDAKGIEHAARSYLNRRLRAAGFDQPGVGPLRIDVSFQKIGEIDYKHVDKDVSVDKVRLELAYFDARGKRLTTVTATPTMHGQEEFKYDAEIALNKAAYGRAVSQILKIDLPSPAELKTQ